jgi:hypothetical protein
VVPKGTRANARLRECVKRWDGMNWMSDGKERKGYKVESKNASADSQDEMTDGNKVGRG